MTLRVLYLATYWDYGDPMRGTSFEENSFHAAFKAHSGIEVVHFDFIEKYQQLGRKRMNDELLALATSQDFDVLFEVTIHDEVAPETLRRISDAGITTIGWGCDDHWRFEDFSRKYAPAFDFWVTTARSALPKFAAIGMAERVIRSQWAVEPTVYYPVDVPRDIDVSFVGQPHGNRREIIAWLASLGVRVSVFGYGWSGTGSAALRSRITHEEMIEVFSRSKVNLNLSNSSVMGEQQIKGRVFEVPGCRGLLLTDAADDLELYYRDGEEIVIYRSPEDLIQKIRWLLEHDEEREAIAQAGYERTLREHTWRRRIDEVFAAAGVGEG